MAVPFFSRSLRNMGSVMKAALGKGESDAPAAPTPFVPAPAVADKPAEPSAAPPQVTLPAEWPAKMAQAATALWRLRRRLCDPQTGQPRDDTRRAFRDLEAAWDALQQAGVVIRDHTGEAYDPGYSLVCLAFQPTSGLERDRIIETVRPTVTVMDQLVQVGEIIVGVPEKKNEG